MLDARRGDRSLGGVPVLVVDDEPDVRELLAAVLARAGCRVTVANDGVDALEMLATGFTPLVIVLDLEMPRLDGEGFLEALAEQGIEHPRVVVFTAHPFRRPKSARVCINKPCSPGGIIDAVSRVLYAA
jgi:two-component system, chemotaxis family, chemotaxis protein CheY